MQRKHYRTPVSNAAAAPGRFKCVLGLPRWTGSRPGLLCCGIFHLQSSHRIPPAYGALLGAQACPISSLCPRSLPSCQHLWVYARTFQQLHPVSFLWTAGRNNFVKTAQTHRTGELPSSPDIRRLEVSGKASFLCKCLGPPYWALPQVSPIFISDCEGTLGWVFFLSSVPHIAFLQ